MILFYNSVIGSANMKHNTPFFPLLSDSLMHVKWAARLRPHVRLNPDISTGDSFDLIAVACFTFAWVSVSWLSVSPVLQGRRSKNYSFSMCLHQPKTLTTRAGEKITLC